MWAIIYNEMLGCLQKALGKETGIPKEIEFTEKKEIISDDEYDFNDLLPKTLIFLPK